MESSLAAVEVYFRKDEKSTSIYEVEDNDESVCFSAFIFPDIIRSCINDKNEQAYYLPINILENRVALLKKEVRLNSLVQYKIDNLIKYIKKNEQNYIGIRVII